MPSKPNIFKLTPEVFAGGLNDTAHKFSRGPTQAKTFSNFKVNQLKQLRKQDGRKYKTQTFTTTNGDILGLIVPPRKICICTINSGNKSLYIKYGASYYTASLAEGDYQTYSSLATALQTALNDAIVGSDPFTVTFTSATRIFTIANAGGGSTAIICFYHDNTTIDPTWFGFVWSASIASGSNATSEFSVPREPPYKICVSSNKKLYDSSKTEITLPDAVSITASGNKWSGVWHMDRWYGSDGDNAYILRDVNYIRKYPSHDLVEVGYTFHNTTTGALYNNLGGAKDGSSTMNKKYYRVNFENAAAGNYTVWAINRITLYFTGNGNTAPWLIKVYFVHTPTNTRTYVGSVNYKDIDNTNGVDTTVNISVSAPLPVFDFKTANCGYLLLELCNATAGPNLQYVANAGYSPFEYLDSDGIWTSMGANKDLCAWVSRQPEALNSASHCYHKFSLENAEGVETDITGVMTDFVHDGAACYMEIWLDVRNYSQYDFKYLNVYRTTCGGSVYYLVCKVPYEMFHTNGRIYFYEGLADSYLDDSALADETTNRDFMPDAMKIVWWDNRSWAVYYDEEDILYYSHANQPEYYDLVNNQIQIGNDGLPIVDAVPLEGRLFVFKQNSLYQTYPVGTEYGHEMLSPTIGTQSRFSAVPVSTIQGSAVFFQGQDGHFYMAGAGGAVNLSQGKLDVLVAGLNGSKLSETFAVYDPINREIIWSVCTGANTTPDTNVVFSLDNQCFYVDTMPARIWAVDYISSGTNTPWLLGSDASNIYHRGQDDGDFSADIPATWESADLDFGSPNEIKDFRSLEIYLTGKATGKSIALTWYVDGSSTAAGTKTIVSGTTGTTRQGSYRVNLGCKGKTLRLKIYNNDNDGYLVVDYILCEVLAYKRTWL